MASKRTAAPVLTAAAETAPLERYTFEKDNEPNAEILLSSLRAAGYSLEAVIGDLVDNSIDAGASLVVVNLDIDVHTEEWEVEVADDGGGMYEPVLDQMMRLGSRTDRDLDFDLGAFGLGSDTAALAIGRNKHVVTFPESEFGVAAMWDLDVIRREQRFVKHLDSASPEERELFRDAFVKAGVEPPSTGTLVRITKCDRIGGRGVETAARHVRKYVGQTYRRFLVPNGGLTVVVNREEVEPNDPTMRQDPDTAILFDEQVDFSWRDENGQEQTEKVGVVIVHLPDKGGPEANRDAGITIDTSGFYMLRNGREIIAATTLRLFGRHAEYSRFRAELSFPARMDAQLGVTFLKSSFEIRPTQSVRDKIDAVCRPYLRQSQQLYKRSRKDADEQVPHDEAAKQIKAKAPFLRKPEAEIEKREPRGEHTDQRPSPDGDKPRSTRTPRERAQKALADQARFEAKQMGPYAPFYEGYLEGRRVVVVYNADHPAYQRLILDNRDNRGQIAAMDFLVWSLVAAELRNVDDNSARYMEAMREDAGFNLRQLLTT
jgi:Histidine kinase-, DNA gyrase B-, and HSP90-like ATPase